MDESKYSPEQLTWLAGRLRKGIERHGKADRKDVIADFARKYPSTQALTPGKLAALYRAHGGNQEAFIAKHDKKEQDEEALRDQMIGQALLDWDPRGAAFATAWALAAKLVNERFGANYRAAQVEAIVRKAGGAFEFLCDCGIEEKIALRAAERAKEPRTTRL